MRHICFRVSLRPFVKQTRVGHGGGRQWPEGGGGTRGVRDWITITRHAECVEGLVSYGVVMHARKHAAVRVNIWTLLHQKEIGFVQHARL
jgi:hypothetical protein